MDQINAILAENIQTYRKRCGMTQDELAERLGVTFQAVSKWENAKCAPDIAFLPTMADLFGCTIDALFSRTCMARSDVEFGLPWEDDGVIRGVVFEGRTLLQAKDGVTNQFTFAMQGDVKDVHSECNITLHGDAAGDCTATGGSIFCAGDIGGSCTATGGSVSCEGDICGDCQTAGGSITCEGDICGSCSVAGGSIFCEGDICGDCTAGGDVTCAGDICGDIHFGGTVHRA